MTQPARAGAMDAAALLNTYRITAAALRRSLELGDIAAEYGNARRAAEHLIGMLDELEPELALLRANRSP